MSGRRENSGWARRATNRATGRGWQPMPASQLGGWAGSPGLRTMGHVTDYCSAGPGPGAQGQRPRGKSAPPEPPAQRRPATDLQRVGADYTPNTQKFTRGCRQRPLPSGLSGRRRSALWGASQCPGLLKDQGALPGPPVQSHLGNGLLGRVSLYQAARPPAVNPVNGRRPIGVGLKPTLGGPSRGPTMISSWAG